MNDFQYLTVRLDAEQRVWLDIQIRDGAPGTFPPEALAELADYLQTLTPQNTSGLVLRYIADKNDTSVITPADYQCFQYFDHNLLLIEKTQQICDLLQSSPIYSVFIIDRQCPVGGMSITLATNYCISSLSLITENFFPINALGLHSTPAIISQAIRRVGAFNALSAIMAAPTLAPRPTETLLYKGFIDAGVPANKLHEAAIDALNKKLRKRKAATAKAPFDNALFRFYTASRLNHFIKKLLKVPEEHYPAPYTLLKLWRKYGSRTDDSTQKAFAESLTKLAASKSSASLQRVARLRHQLSKVTGDSWPLKHLHIIGSGETACQIISYCLLQGIRVSMQDKRPEALERALETISQKLLELLGDDKQLKDLLSHITTDPKGHNIKTADMILLAGSSTLATQQEKFAELEELSRPDAILATHSAIVPLEKIAGVMLKPERLLGVHFCHPAYSTPLVEVSYTPETDPQLLEKACNILRHINKLPLLLNNIPGLLADRILVQYILQGIHLHQQGVPHTVIDNAAHDAGMPSGPLELGDLIGLDYCLQVAEVMEKAFGTDVPFQLVTMVQTGQLGKKSGSGFYRYRNNNRLKPERMSWDGNISALQAKLTARITEEAAMCLEDGLLDNSGLVDAGIIFGTGFAPWTGGPLHYQREN